MKEFSRFYGKETRDQIAASDYIEKSTIGILLNPDCIYRGFAINWRKLKWSMQANKMSIYEVTFLDAKKSEFQLLLYTK